MSTLEARPTHIVWFYTVNGQELLVKASPVYPNAVVISGRLGETVAVKQFENNTYVYWTMPESEQETYY